MNLRSSPEYLEVEQMRTALGEIGTLLKTGKPIPRAWAQWLGNALEQISHGGKVDRALGLKRFPGRPRKVEPHEVAAELRIKGASAHADEFPIDKGNGVWKESTPRGKQSQDKAAKKLKVSEKTIQRGKKEWLKRTKEGLER